MVEGAMFCNGNQGIPSKLIYIYIFLYIYIFIRIMHCSSCTSWTSLGPAMQWRTNLTCQASLVCRNLCVAKALKPVHFLQPPEALTEICSKFLEHHVLHGSYHIVWCCVQPWRFDVIWLVCQSVCLPFVFYPVVRSSFREPLDALLLLPSPEK